MSRLFEPGFAYPSDREGGRYVDMPGRVVHVDRPLSERKEYPITVETTEHGEHKGFTGYLGGFEPRVGDLAIIRVYDWGGGWYPDNRVSSLHRPAPGDAWKPASVHARWSGHRLCECSFSTTLMVSELLAEPPPTCGSCAALLCEGRFMRYNEHAPWLWQVPARSEAR